MMHEYNIIVFQAYYAFNCSSNTQKIAYLFIYIDLDAILVINAFNYFMIKAAPLIHFTFIFMINRTYY